MVKINAKKLMTSLKRRAIIFKNIFDNFVAYMTRFKISKFRRYSFFLSKVKIEDGQCDLPNVFCMDELHGPKFNDVITKHTIFEKQFSHFLGNNTS